MSCSTSGGPNDQSFPVTRRFTFRSVGDRSRERGNSDDTARLPMQGTACDCSRERRNSHDTARLPVQASASDCSRQRRNSDRSSERLPSDRPPVRVSKIAVAGNTLIIGHFANANPDCTASGRTFVRVSGNPSHGVVTMREGLGFSNFPKQPECNSHKMQGVTVEYTPYDGFTGSDEVEFDVVSQIGGEVFVTYVITVMAWDSSDAHKSPCFLDLNSPLRSCAYLRGIATDHEAQAQVTEIMKAPMDSSKAQAPATPSESPASLPTAPNPPGGSADAIPTQEYAPMLPGGARAAMLIASPDNPQKPITNLGSAVWSTIPPAPGQPATVAVKADADIPDLKMHASMTLRKNTDPTLQATHTIDLKFSFADGAPIAGFKDVGAPQMRKLDRQRRRR